MRKFVAIMMSAVMLSGCTSFLVKDIKEVNRQIKSAYDYNIVLEDEIIAVGYANKENLQKKLIIAGKNNSYVLDNPELLQILGSFDFNNLALGNDSFYINEDDSIEKILQRKSNPQTYSFRLDKLNKNRTFQSQIDMSYFKLTHDLTQLEKENLVKYAFECKVKVDKKLNESITICRKTVSLNVIIAQRISNLNSFEQKFSGKRQINIMAKKTRYGDVFLGYLQYPLVVVGDLIILPLAVPFVLGGLAATGMGCGTCIGP